MHAATSPSVLLAQKVPHLGASGPGPGTCPVRATVCELPGEMCASVKRHTESPEMVMTMFCYLYAVFFACLLKCGVTVSETDPNKALLIRPGMFLSGKRKMLSSNKAAFSPQETHLFKDCPVNL